MTAPEDPTPDEQPIQGPRRTRSLHLAITGLTDDELLRALDSLVKSVRTDAKVLSWWRPLMTGVIAELVCEQAARFSGPPPVAALVAEAMAEANATIVREHYLDAAGLVGDEEPYPEWTGPSEITVEKHVAKPPIEE